MAILPHVQRFDLYVTKRFLYKNLWAYGWVRWQKTPPQSESHRFKSLIWWYRSAQLPFLILTIENESVYIKWKIPKFVNCMLTTKSRQTLEKRTLCVFQSSTKLYRACSFVLSKMCLQAQPSPNIFSFNKFISPCADRLLSSISLNQSLVTEFKLS